MDAKKLNRYVTVTTKVMDFSIPVSFLRKAPIVEKLLNENPSLRKIDIEGEFTKTSVDRVRKWLGDPKTSLYSNEDVSSTVRFLGTLGLIEEALNLLKSSDCKPDALYFLFHEKRMLTKDIDLSFLRSNRKNVLLDRRCFCDSLALLNHLKDDLSGISYDLLTEEEREQASKDLRISRKELKKILKVRKVILRDKYPTPILKARCSPSLLLEKEQICFGFYEAEISASEGLKRVLVRGLDENPVTVEYDPELHSDALLRGTKGQVVKILGYIRDFENNISYATSVTELY